MFHLQTPLESIPQITPKYSKLLEKLGLLTVEDFLFYFPSRYDDFSKTVSLDAEFIGQTITVEGLIIKTKSARIPNRRMTIFEIELQDESGNILKANWFNQPFLASSLQEGLVIRLSGKLEVRGKYFSMANPAWENAKRDITNTGGLIPVYPETKGLTSKWIRWQMKRLLESGKQLHDILPEEIREKLKLYNTYTALKQIHFPTSPERLMLSQKRFAFQEIFLIQLKALQVRNQWNSNITFPIKFEEEIIKNFVDNLPFKLTNAQRKASFEILQDLEKSTPMNRLLNGDVGAGKTLVAVISALQAMHAGFQVAIMAPTEVLAKQHFVTITKLLGAYDISVALLTGSHKEVSNFEFRISNFDSNSNFKNSNLKIDPEFKIKNSKLSRKELLDKIKLGDINLVIGTHAIIQKDVAFKNLALVIIDEQHRFGVAQRAALQTDVETPRRGVSTSIPHLLTMTATPIPRTLAIAGFGSLDLSILDEMPANRKKIITKIIPPVQKKQAYEFLRQQVSEGRQIFVIFPLVEESKIMTEVKAAVAEHKRLSEEVFPDLRLGLLHGKMKGKEKEQVMQDFKDKKLDILISTSVIEVGIDIPNATVMMIEDADRFGLSQLHQFRGRVGRSDLQSYCFLFTNSNTDKTLERLQALEDSNDGFELAQKDLELRGPGQFFGTLQSGIPDIVMEHLGNLKLIKCSREEAANILQHDPQLKKHPLLENALRKFQTNTHLE
jgi:ATP-dependent DNA helicase RecG